MSTNTAIGLDRLRVVVFPMTSRTGGGSRTGCVIVIIWVIAMGVAAVQLAVGRVQYVELTQNDTRKVCYEIWPQPENLWRRAYTFFVLIITYILPLVTLSIAYGVICSSLRRHIAPGNAHQNRDARQMKKKKKVRAANVGAFLTRIKCT